jgi:hypothetical protein
VKEAETRLARQAFQLGDLHQCRFKDSAVSAAVAKYWFAPLFPTKNFLRKSLTLLTILGKTQFTEVWTREKAFLPTASFPRSDLQSQNELIGGTERSCHENEDSIYRRVDQSQKTIRNAIVQNAGVTQWAALRCSTVDDAGKNLLPAGCRRRRHSM